MTKSTRKIIKIDEDLCTGCGSCIPGCAEQALQLVDTPNGKKARMVKDVYCDGLGACLGTCPTGALSIEEREAEPFDEAAAMEHVKYVAPELLAEHKKVPDENASELAVPPTPAISHNSEGCPGARTLQWAKTETVSNDSIRLKSELRQWPTQLHLVPPSAPYFQNADLVFIADCVPFAYANAHQDFIKGKSIAHCCPKLDDVQSYIPKVANIIKTAKPKSITVVHMEVPCCFGLLQLVKMAAQQAQSNIPIEEVTIGIKGEILK